MLRISPDNAHVDFTVIRPMPAPVRRVAMDLAEDLSRILGTPVRTAEPGPTPFTFHLDPDLGPAEAYRVEVSEQGVAFRGADPLGVAYGVYAFCRECLGVDPMWFWKQTPPTARAVIELEPRVLTSSPATFRYRGWFINDEDLLTYWSPTGVPGRGIRDIDYIFYHHVVHLDVVERILEACLRCGFNLIIPASFVDIMNPDEAMLIQRAVDRGLYVTQHHIEPLGVSHFGFESYWRKRGEQPEFAYGKAPERVRQTWHAYTERWREVAGDRVIWQLGLRGRGDAPIWAHDGSVSRADAGRFISQALADQMAIVREVDARAHPPATQTLWLEGSKLMSEGVLDIPEDAMIVFADEPYQQLPQADFYNTPRDPNRGHGMYYHIAFWMNGCHLVQGTRLEKMQHVVHEMIGKGDTDYFIANVSNLREFVLPAQALGELLHQGKHWEPAAFWASWCPEGLRPLYQRFFDTLLDLDDKHIMQDGYVVDLTKQILDEIDGQKTNWHTHRFSQWMPEGPRAFVERLTAAADIFDALADEFPDAEGLAGLTPEQYRFFHENLVLQAGHIARLYRIAAAELRTCGDGDWTRVVAAIDETIAFREQLAQHLWLGWYAGEHKENWRSFRHRVQAIVEAGSPPQPEEFAV